MDLTVGYTEDINDEVTFILVLDQPLSSNTYYVIRRSGRHRSFFSPPNFRSLSSLVFSIFCVTSFNCDVAREATKFLTWRKQFKHGHGDFKPNVNNALKMFLKAAELRSTKAMVDAGLIFWERGDKVKAFGLYREAAEAGDRNAQGNLGMWYLQE
ncbi:putative tetratricopeptide-like helical domain-containing protein [Rosa chinensis]|uniref:Putative tetratricopeptide-like helical domain-containing protein n=1 Tax=Rosa chinensis TaxID=74649 RepID=A0A2P6R227_ROSCH|nr:putative tetratricopeptide-like helical domain-containing protein [Rosa chinensis]